MRAELILDRLISCREALAKVDFAFPAGGQAEAFSSRECCIINLDLCIADIKASIITIEDVVNEVDMLLANHPEIGPAIDDGWKETFYQREEEVVAEYTKRGTWGVLLLFGRKNDKC